MPNYLVYCKNEKQQVGIATDDYEVARVQKSSHEASTGHLATIKITYGPLTKVFLQEEHKHLELGMEGEIIGGLYTYRNQDVLRINFNSDSKNFRVVPFCKVRFKD